MKKICVRLGGGLGNQLFQYYAGELLARKYNRKLILDDRFIATESAHKGRSQLGFIQEGVRGFNLDVTYAKKYPAAIFLPVQKIFDRILVQIKIMGVMNFYGSSIGNQLSELTIPEEQLHFKTIVLKGNFQSLAIVEKAIEQGAPINLTQKVASRIQAPSANELKPIVIHIRLTDYVIDDPTFMLNAAYYEKGLTGLSNTFPTNPIWVFSDDPITAANYLPEKFLERITFFNDPGILSDIEELLLMSQGTAFVISNSTFAFWAALLSKSPHVIAPEPWYKGSVKNPKFTHFTYPNSWIKHEW